MQKVFLHRSIRMVPSCVVARRASDRHANDTGKAARTSCICRTRVRASTSLLIEPAVRSTLGHRYAANDFRRATRIFGVRFAKRKHALACTIDYHRALRRMTASLQNPTSVGSIWIMQPLRSTRLCRNYRCVRDFSLHLRYTLFRQNTQAVEIVVGGTGIEPVTPTMSR